MEESPKETHWRSLPFLVAETQGGVVLKRGTTQILIEGESALETILLILVGTTDDGQTKAEICVQFPEPDRQAIRDLLDDMIAKRLLIPAHDADNPEQPETNEDLFYWTANRQRSEVAQTLSGLDLTIIGVNRLSLAISRSLNNMGVTNISVADDPLLRNLEFFDAEGNLAVDAFEGTAKVCSSVQLLESGLTAKCLLAASEFGSQAALLPWNEECVNRGIHFMPVYLMDMTGYAGPLVVPGETACLQCLRMRQNAHLQDAPVVRDMEEHLQRGQAVVPIHPSMIAILAESVVFELCHFYGKLSEPRPGRLITIDLPRGKTQSRRVLKIPRCPVCSPLIHTSTVQIRKLTPLPE